jgi:hypothetical protein
VIRIHHAAVVAVNGRVIDEKAAATAAMNVAQPHGLDLLELPGGHILLILLK